jgi:hypothetical protein
VSEEFGTVKFGADEFGADEFGADEFGADEFGAYELDGTVAPCCNELAPERTADAVPLCDMGGFMKNAFGLGLVVAPEEPCWPELGVSFALAALQLRSLPFVSIDLINMAAPIATQRAKPRHRANPDAARQTEARSHPNAAPIRGTQPAERSAPIPIVDCRSAPLRCASACCCAAGPIPTSISCHAYKYLLLSRPVRQHSRVRPARSRPLYPARPTST